MKDASYMLDLSRLQRLTPLKRPSQKWNKTPSLLTISRLPLHWGFHWRQKQRIRENSFIHQIQDPTNLGWKKRRDFPVPTPRTCSAEIDAKVPTRRSTCDSCKSWEQIEMFHFYQLQCFVELLREPPKTWLFLTRAAADGEFGVNGGPTTLWCSTNQTHF